MKILSIGNSFSVDAQAYLHALAQTEGEQLECVNLFIPGCSLQTHWENMQGDLANYCLFINGEEIHPAEDPSANRMISIHEALTMDEWDVITLQQCSPLSGRYETYQPYLNELSAYAARYAPQARQWIHQTWAYEKGSDLGHFANYDYDQQLMFDSLKKSYAQAAEDIGAPVIPSGDVIQALRGLPPFDTANGGISLCRDGFHMSIPLGRYVLAIVWYTALTGKAVTHDALAPEDCSEEELGMLRLIRETAAKMILNGK